MGVSIWVRLHPSCCAVIDAVPGHALNKILKDIILRFHVLQGRQVQSVLSLIDHFCALTETQLCTRVGLPWPSHREQGARGTQGMANAPQEPTTDSTC